MAVLMMMAISSSPPPLPMHFLITALLGEAQGKVPPASVTVIRQLEALLRV